MFQVPASPGPGPNLRLRQPICPNNWEAPGGRQGPRDHYEHHLAGRRMYFLVAPARAWSVAARVRTPSSVLNAVASAEGGWGDVVGTSERAHQARAVVRRTAARG
jgi:hypothetical protein